MRADKFSGFIFLVALCVVAGRPAIGQQSFSCPLGKTASCLDYNDKVCSSFAKCVDQSATCFDAYTCKYGGFICKSKFDELVEEYNDLLSRAESLVSEYDSLRDEYEEEVDRYNSLLTEHSDMKSCIEYAASLNEAQECTW